MTTGSLLLLLATAHADWPAGAEIWPALYLDVTPEGFASLEGIARTFLPPTVPIDPSLIDQSGGADLLIIEAEYSFSAENLFVTPELVSLNIVPGTDVLDVTAVADVSLSSADSPAILHVNASVGFLGLFDWEAIDEDCEMWIDRARTTLTARVRIEMERDRLGNLVRDADGNIKLVVEIEDVAYTLPPLGQEDLNLGSAPGGSCIIDDLADLADDLFGLDVVELLLEEITPTLDAQIDTLLADVQSQIDALLPALVIEEQLDLLGTTMNVGLRPGSIHVEPAGLRVQMDGVFDTGPTPHPCVSRFDDGLSEQSIPGFDPRYPFVGETPAGVTRGIGALINDDWLNQAAYAAWRGGLLCFEISDGNSPVELPLPINTSLLGILAPDGFSALFPTPAPLVLKTRPEKEPLITVGQQHAVDVFLDGLGLDFYGEIDGRLSRLAGLDLSAAIGADVTFDPETSTLGAEVDFDPSAIAAVVSFNDLNPAANASMESNFSTLAETLVGPLLGEALSGLSFPIPSFSGIGVVAAEIGTAGPIQDFLGVWGAAGAVEAGPEGGCDTADPAAGCGDTGCATTDPRALPVAMLALLAARRRRRA